MATYLVGYNKGTSKKDDSTYYRAFFLAPNKWGNWEVSMKYITPEVYAQIERQKISEGAAVDVQTVFGSGDIIGVKVLDNIPALKLIH